MEIPKIIVDDKDTVTVRSPEKRRTAQANPNPGPGIKYTNNQMIDSLDREFCFKNFASWS